MTAHRFLIALLIACFASIVHVDPVAFDYRCGSEIDLARGVPADGWTTAKNGRLRGKAGDPCWLRIDACALAPQVLRVSGADGYKSVALFDVSGRRVAVANDAGIGENAIVVLMDVQMPEMDALEASREIVRRWTDRRRIVAMTASAMQSDRNMCLAAGMDDYVTMRIRVDALLASPVRQAVAS